MVLKLAEVLNVNKEELLTLWLADQLSKVAGDEEVALKAMQVAEEEIKYKSKSKKNKK